jgi:hypothetical protein
MTVRCNRAGGFGLKVEDPNLENTDGTPKMRRIRIKHGLNDVDPELVAEALGRLPKAMAEAMTSRKANGMPPDLELDAKPAADAPEHMNAREKVRVVREAQSAEELRSLGEGEERQTVLEAIAKRGEELGEG